MRGCQRRPEAPHPARLAQRDEILGQPRDRLKRGQRAVGEPLRQAGLLDEGIGEVSRVGHPGPGDADRDDRHHPQGERRAGRDGRRGQPQWADRHDDRRARVAVGRREEGVEEPDREGRQPQGGEPAGEVGRRRRARARGRRRWRRRPRAAGGPGRVVVASASEPRDHDRQRHERARPTEEAGRDALVAPRDRDHAARSAPTRPAARRTTRRPTSPARRRSCVAATIAAPASTCSASSPTRAA